MYKILIFRHTIRTKLFYIKFKGKSYKIKLQLVENWDFKNKKIKSKYPNSPRLNSFLANKFTELQDQVFEHKTFTKSSTTKQLKEKICGKKPTDLFVFPDEAFENYLQENKG